MPLRKTTKPTRARKSSRATRENDALRKRVAQLEAERDGLASKPITALDLDDERDWWRFIATLAELREGAGRRGVSKRDALAAYFLAQRAIQALAGHPKALADVKRIEAFQRGATGPDSDALAILDIVRVVDGAAWLLKHRNDPPFVPGQTNIHADAAQDEPASLRSYLVAAYGESVPSVEDLTDWLDRHADKGARGKLTTAGIVAQIIHRGRLLGARGDSEHRTLQRVDKALARHVARPVRRVWAPGDRRGSAPPFLDGSTDVRRGMSSDRDAATSQPRVHEHDDAKHPARMPEADADRRAPRRRRGRM